MGLIYTTLPAMEVRTSSNTAEMSTIFIWIGLAIIVGTLLIGPLFDRVNDLLLVSVCLAAMGIFMSLAPTWPNLLVFQAQIALMTLFYYALHSGKLHLSDLTTVVALWARGA